jgi:glutamyl-tRNA synthetase
MAPERVRFAPSPTGMFHVGSARTALYNWLVARQTHGSFLLRIDDTDTQRNQEAWVDGIFEAMTWLGLHWDEGPIRQSTRLAHYLEAARRLENQGDAYWCDCTREALEARKRPGDPPGYDGFCRTRGLGPGPGRALRFRVPDREVLVKDLVRGSVRFPAGSIEDFVIVKSTGQPLYVLANVIDDVDFAITLVLRAEEHLPTTPKAILLHEALGTPTPRFAHLSFLVNAERRKLSKRRDRVAVEDYRAMGILPWALLNYVALLGWSPGTDEEFFSRDELVERFDLGRISHSPAFFDERKLLAFNQHYLATTPPEELVELGREHFEAVGALNDAASRERLVRILPLVAPRVHTLAEAAAMASFLFSEPSLPVEELEALNPAASGWLDAARRSLANLPTFDAASIEASLRTIAAELGTSLRKLQAPIRIAATGSRVGPPLFESLELLGKERTLARLDALRERMAAQNPAATQ